MDNKDTIDITVRLVPDEESVKNVKDTVTGELSSAKIEFVKREELAKLFKSKENLKDIQHALDSIAQASGKIGNTYRSLSSLVSEYNSIRSKIDTKLEDDIAKKQAEINKQIDIFITKSKEREAAVKKAETAESKLFQSKDMEYLIETQRNILKYQQDINDFRKRGVEIAKEQVALEQEADKKRQEWQEKAATKQDRIAEAPRGTKRDVGTQINEEIAALKREEAELRKLADQRAKEAQQIKQAELDTIKVLNEEQKDRVDLINTLSQEKKAVRDKLAATSQERKEAFEKLKDLEAERAKLLGIASDEQQRAEYNSSHNQMLEDQLRRITEEYNKQFQKLEAIDVATQARLEKERAIQQQMIDAHKEEQNVKAEQQRVKMTNARATAMYKVLRTIKMAGFQIDQMNKKMDSLINASINGFKGLAKTLFSISVGFTNLIPHINKAAKGMKSIDTSTNGFHKNLKTGITTLLKYGLGIRSIYLAINLLRRSMYKALGEMAKQFADVNKNVSSIIASLRYMQAAVATAVEPLLNLLAPALEKISALLEKASYAIASFIAALTGQATVKRAVKQTYDYAAAQDKLAKSTKDANKQLAAHNKLNVLTSKNNSGKDTETPFSWVEEPIDSKIADFAKKVQDGIKRLLAPIKDAWDKWKDYVISSWKYALDEILKLGKSIARDFWKVWEEPDTERIFENIFHILGNIGKIIGNIAKGWREAWDWKDDRGLTNGYRILRAIRDIILIISQDIVEMTDFLVKWTASLNWIPLFTAVADVLEQNIVPAIEQVGDLLKTLFIDIVNVIGTWFIESAAPKILYIIGDIASTIGNIAEQFRKAWEEGEKGRAILEELTKLANIVLDAIAKMAAETKEWAKSLNFNPLLESLNTWLVSLEKPLQTLMDLIVYMDKTVVRPFMQYMITEGGPKLLIQLTEFNNAVDWDHLKNKMQEFMDVLEPFLEKAWEAFLLILDDLGEAFKKFAQEGGPLDWIIDHLKDWMENASPEEMARGIENFAKALIVLKGALVALSVIQTVAQNMMVWKVLIANTQMALAGNGAGNAAAGGLAGGATTAANSLDELAAALDANGAAAEATTAGPLAKLKGAFEGLGSTVKTFAADANEALVGAANGSTTSLGQAGSVGAGVSGGVLMSIIGLGISAISTGTMMEEGFSVGGEAGLGLGATMTGVGATIALVSAGIITAVGAIPLAVAAAIAVIIFAIGNFMVAVTKYPEEFAKMINDWSTNMKKKWEEGWKKWWEDCKKIFEKFRDIGKTLGKIIGEWIAKIPEKVDKAIEGFKKFPENFKKWISEVNWADLGIAILEGILQVFLIPVKLVGYIASAIAGFFTGFVEGLQEGFDMHSPSKKMYEYGVNILEGILEGIKQALKDIPTWIKANIFDPISDGLKTAFGIADGAATKMLEIGKNIVQGLFNGIKEKYEDVKDRIKGFWDNITHGAKTSFDENSPSKVFTDIGDNVSQGLFNGIVFTIEKLLPTLVNIFGTIISAVNNLMSQVTTGISSALSGIVSGISSLAGQAVNALRTMATQAVNSLKNIFSANALSNVARTALNGFIGVLQSMGSNIASTARTLFTNVVTGIKNIFTSNSLRNIATGALNAFLNTLKSIGNTIFTNAKSIFNNVVNGIKGIFTNNALSNIAKNGMNGFLNAVKTVGNTILTNAKKLVTDVLNAFKNSLTGTVLNAVGSTFLKGLNTGITSQQGSLLNTVANICTSVLNSFRNALSGNSLFNIGGNIVRGLVNGITDAASDAYRTISRVANNVIEHTRNVFDINSPSKVFAEIGMYLMKGLKKGIEDNVKDVNNATEDISPDTSVLDDFYSRYIEMIANMRESSLEAFQAISSAFLDMSSDFDKISNINSMIEKVSNIKVPDIAKGFTLPTAIQIAANTEPSEVDLSEIEDDIYNLTRVVSGQTEILRGILNKEFGISGTELFRSVQSSANNYYKRTGNPAFAM